MKNTQNTNKALVDALVYNNRFASVKVDGDQIGVEAFSAWKALVEKLHRAAYKAYVVCENSGLKAESNSIDKTEIFDVIREILATIGTVNEHKMYANAEMAIAMISYSGKRANKDSGELQFCLSRIRNLKKEISDYEALNVTDEEFKANKLAEMRKSLEVLEEEKSALLKTADMRIKQPTRTTANAFRLDVEHFLARAITGQLAKTPAELDAEDAERKAKRAEAAAKYASEYSEKFESPYQAASKGMITDVIEPAETRGALAMALRATLSKRETRLPKKHGNIPM